MANIAQLVEHVHGKDEVIGSIPIVGSLRISQCYTYIVVSPRQIKIVITCLVLGWSALFLAHYIDLSTADLGRHLMNGRLLVEAPWAEKMGVLHTNFYSYTMPDQPFVNHHWLSGVIFYLVEMVSGFAGLSIFYILLFLAAIALVWNVARKVSTFYVATAVLIFLLPLMVGRVEVRPEVWSYLLSGVVLNLCYFRRYLWSIPLIMLLWVNLHIGFIFGFLILGAYLLEEWRRFTPILLASLLAACVNPFGYHTVLFPLLILTEYGYRIVENQSIFFLERLGFTEGMHFLLFKLSALAVLVSGIALYVRKVRVPLAFSLLVLTSGVLACLGIRHFPFFAFFALVFLSYAFYHVVVTRSHKHMSELALIVVVVISFSFQMSAMARTSSSLGVSLVPGINSAAEFFEAHQLAGPIFNNYDIGGYLIYHLYPEKVFVDNRPEAYTTEFFNEYIRVQEDPVAWEALEEKYHFNVIVFSHRDYTPWGQTFLAARVSDPTWAAVFVDDFNIIFLKRNSENAAFIKEFEIPREAFGTSVNR